MSFVCTQFKYHTILFILKPGPYQVLPLRVKVDLGAMAMNGYSRFLKVSGLKPHHQIV